MQWQHPGGVVIDSSPKSDKGYWWEQTNKNQFVDSFRDVTRRSRFVICPRGVSPSSIRLFEAMEAGSVPVIISDDLELPLGPRWEEFSLRVREQDIDDIPRLIERRQDQASEMGAAARRTWETYFSPQATVGSIVGWAQRLLAHSHHRPILLQIREYTTPRLVRPKLRYALGWVCIPKAPDTALQRRGWQTPPFLLDEDLPRRSQQRRPYESNIG